MMVVVVMVHVRHHDLFDFDYCGRFMLTRVLKMLMILASTLCQRSGRSKNTRHSKKFPCLHFSSGFFCYLGGGSGNDDDDNSDDCGDDGDVDDGDGGGDDDGDGGDDDGDLVVAVEASCQGRAADQGEEGEAAPDCHCEHTCLRR